MLMERHDIVQHLLEYTKGTRYLEVGVADGLTYNRIKVPVKHGIDPATPNGTHMMTSDVFFERIEPEQLYDVIFIDGLHTQEQVSRDIDHSLAHLARGGYIVLHDMLPPDLAHESPDFCGTCWRAIADRRHGDPHFLHLTVDTDYGVGVCRRDTAITLPLWLEKPQGGWTYEYFLKKRNDLMNVVSVSRFRSLFNNAI